MFSISFSALLFFQCFFDYSDRINREFITKSIKSNNCKETSLPLKRTNIVLIIVAVKLLPLQPYDRTYFSLKTANVCIFWTVNRKPYTWSPNGLQQHRFTFEYFLWIRTLFFTLLWFTELIAIFVDIHRQKMIVKQWKIYNLLRGVKLRLEFKKGL